MKEHSIVPGGDTCSHGGWDPPWGKYTRSKPGELRRCPTCLKWWRAKDGYDWIWEPVSLFDFKSRRYIREFEARERKQMHVLIHSDKEVED